MYFSSGSCDDRRSADPQCLPSEFGCARRGSVPGSVAVSTSRPTSPHGDGTRSGQYPRIPLPLRVELAVNLLHHSEERRGFCSWHSLPRILQCTRVSSAWCHRVPQTTGESLKHHHVGFLFHFLNLCSVIFFNPRLFWFVVCPGQ